MFFVVLKGKEIFPGEKGFRENITEKNPGSNSSF